MSIYIGPASCGNYASAASVYKFFPGHTLGRRLNQRPSEDLITVHIVWLVLYPCHWQKPNFLSWSLLHLSTLSRNTTTNHYQIYQSLHFLVMWEKQKRLKHQRPTPETKTDALPISGRCFSRRGLYFHESTSWWLRIFRVLFPRPVGQMEGLFAHVLAGSFEVSWVVHVYSSKSYRFRYA